MLYVAPMDMEPGKVRIVLHRPQSAENIGAAARAMKNFGLSRLAIVAPPSWAGPPRSGGPGTAREDVLAPRPPARAPSLRHPGGARRSTRTCASALGPAVWTCGTTSRAVEGRPRLDPAGLAAEVARRSAHGEVAIVFGQERRGLSDAELELCQAVCSIPTAPAYDSMNLAQSVAVLALRDRTAAGVRLRRRRAPAEPARHATLEALWDRLRTLLGAAGYLNPQNPEHILADLRRLLARAEPTQREVELVLAAVRALERKLRERVR